MRDVAAQAGVSVQTVSNLVNGRPHLMRPETRERIEEALAILDYRPNATARGLRSARTRSIGFLVVDDESSFLADPMNSMVMAGSAAAASESDHRLLIQSAPLGEVDDGVFAPWHEHRIDGGILFMSGSRRQRDVYIRRASELGLPCVLVGETDGSHPAVTAANRDGAFALTRHLVERGHSRIAFIAGGVSWPMIEQRHAGYRAALREAGVDPARELQLLRGRFDPAGGEALAEALLELREPPTAIVAANDVLALGVYRSADQRGLTIPDDLAVTGFLDFDFSGFLNPALTTVAVPTYEMGRAAARMVVDQLEGLDGDQVEHFEVDVLIRQSS
jgi:DNA-binding LacI/PurR family transcriptional regulator